VWECLYDEVSFKLVCYDNNYTNNIAVKASGCRFKNSMRQFIFMRKVDLYGFIPDSDKFNKLESLYLCANRFADIGYYRLSCRLYNGTPNLKIDRIGDLILLKYKAIALNREDDGDANADSSFCFVLSQMKLVGSMQHVVV